MTALRFFFSANISSTKSTPRVLIKEHCHRIVVRATEGNDFKEKKCSLHPLDGQPRARFRARLPKFWAHPSPHSEALPVRSLLRKPPNSKGSSSAYSGLSCSSLGAYCDKNRSLLSCQLLFETASRPWDKWIKWMGYTPILNPAIKASIQLEIS